MVNHAMPADTGYYQTSGELPYDPTEQEVLIGEFTAMLWSVTRDGGQKRARGQKPEWWRDGSHEAAIFSHINKWKHGETVDKDSGVHPLVHLAWRALAIAYQEMNGKVDPVVLRRVERGVEEHRGIKPLPSPHTPPPHHSPPPATPLSPPYPPASTE